MEAYETARAMYGAKIFLGVDIGTDETVVVAFEVGESGWKIIDVERRAPTER